MQIACDLWQPENKELSFTSAYPASANKLSSSVSVECRYGYESGVSACIMNKLARIHADFMFYFNGASPGM